MEQVYLHLRNVSIKIEKDISSRAGDISETVGFHHGNVPTTRLTYKKSEIIWNQCTNVSGIEKIKTSGDTPLSNFSKEVSKQTG